MQETLFDVTLSDSLAGFRLQRLEVYNWGTFDRRIWKIEPNGSNSLLTGDVGSGKSTLVDALTTLLVPHQRIVYNKAAGAESKERSLYSYIRGEYKNEKDGLSQSAKPITLRGQNNYSVLLAVFSNEGFSQSVTLAQVFWLKDAGKSNPERFFVFAPKELSIAEHFSGFGSDVLDLKRRLRKTDLIEVLETFREYSGRFRSAFGIEHEQALELFYQTISLKSVANITNFVRSHMLESDDVSERIEELRRNFDNLNRAHETILSAKRQLELLNPILDESTKYKDLARDIGELRLARDSLVGFFADKQVGLLDVRINDLDLDHEKIKQRIESAEIESQHLRTRERELRDAIYREGGNRLETIQQEISSLALKRDQAKKLRAEYDTLFQDLGLKAPRDEGTFAQNKADAMAIVSSSDDELTQIGEQRVQSGIDLQNLRRQVEDIRKEIKSLQARKSNIRAESLELRAALCEAIGAPEQDIPFVGELLQVAESESAWEGAIERALHGFAQSLLVPDRLYPKVTQYVDSTRLRGKIVYFKVNADTKHRHNGDDVHPRSLSKKLLLKPDTPFREWLESELASRYDFACCDTLENFQRESFAITKSGQMKTGGRRHEKDDRSSLNDRTRYLLGWTNHAKIQALDFSARSREKQAADAAQTLATFAAQEKSIQKKRDTARDLQQFESFSSIHWQSHVRRIEELNDERKAIEDGSDTLRSLQTSLSIVEEELKIHSAKTNELIGRKSVIEDQRQEAVGRKTEAIQLRDKVPEERKTIDFPKITELYSELFANLDLTLKNIDKTHSELREQLTTRIDNEDKRGKRLTEKLIAHMHRYKSDFPVESQDLGVGMEYIDEFERVHARIHSEDLPRHEERFKQLLNEGTINSVALLQHHLERARQGIEEKIGAINGSLRQIEYNKGTYIELALDRTQDRDIRDFQQDLRRCLDHGLEDGAIYNENRFLQVKAILDRFNGRLDLTEIDRRWTEKVTDVRNWFEFSASERWQSDGTEKEFYSDSSGKSGGQKEKLAYTILASALAYQFGLEWNTTRSRSFRFVVIDEAFGRGSDESTRYGLELFKRLNLQLLVVTPLQKINIIEDYVRSVHYVHNEQGKNSVIRNLSIEQYRVEREKFLAQVSV